MRSTAEAAAAANNSSIRKRDWSIKNPSFQIRRHWILHRFHFGICFYCCRERACHYSLCSKQESTKERFVSSHQQDVCWPDDRNSGSTNVHLQHWRRFSALDRWTNDGLVYSVHILWCFFHARFVRYCGFYRWRETLRNISATDAPNTINTSIPHH